MGGEMSHGPVIVERDEPVYHARWEGRVHGMMRRLLAARVFNLDQFRHTVEQMPREEYLASTYYERWLAALERLVAKTAGPKRDLPERHVAGIFRPGDAVITKALDQVGHTRLPRYARGKRGFIEAVHAQTKLPDTNAMQVSHDWEPFYTVVFEARELWGPEADPKGRVSIDLWQSYLVRTAS
jgi:nitrile hydratase